MWNKFKYAIIGIVIGGLIAIPSIYATREPGDSTNPSKFANKVSIYGKRSLGDVATEVLPIRVDADGYLQIDVRKLPLVRLFPKTLTSHNVLQQDTTTEALCTIEYELCEIHKGNSYSTYYSVTTASSDDDVTAIGFTTPNTTKYLHLVVGISASDPAEFFLEEDTTIDNDAGSPLNVQNRNRNSGNVAGLYSLNTTPVVGRVTTFDETQYNGASHTAGTILDYTQLAGGSGPFAVGGASRGTQVWVLKPNTKYLLRLQNIGGTTNVHTIHMDWYELIDKH